MTGSDKKLTRREALKLLGAIAGAGVLANLPTKWNSPEVTSGVLPAHAQTSEILPTETPIPVPPTVSTVSITSDIVNPNMITLRGNVTDGGNSPVTARGFVWSQAPNTTPTIDTGTVMPVGSGLGEYFTTDYFANGLYYGRAYATNAAGTAYGSVIIFVPDICLVEGTLVSMADGTTKKIEEITYSDRLAVWNFDEGRFDEAQPLFIKEEQIANGYCLLEFSDGSSLKIINQHRIFNKEEGMFTFTMSEDTPVGTTTFNVDGRDVRLVRTQVVEEEVRYYNVITFGHMNLFANGILASIGLNNLYPIVDMKFVKQARAVVPQEVYGVDETYYAGLRLAEQTTSPADVVAYIHKIDAHRVEEPEAELAFA